MNRGFIIACLFALSITVFSLGIRFYDFRSQWDLFGDAGRDQLVGWGAVQLDDIPLVGSFSSSGPFVFGPLYYWIIAASYIFFPIIPDAPQMMFRLITLIPLLFYWQSGQLLGKRRLAMIVVLLAATSPVTVERSISMTHHALVGVVSAALVWLFLRYLRGKGWMQYLTVFAMGLVYGIGVNVHFQTINLWPVFLIYLAVNKFRVWRIWKELTCMVIGFMLPNIPYMIWDATINGWANTRNFLDYVLIVQERRYVPNRWLTYLFDFWPLYWSSLIGGFRVFGYVVPALVGLVWIWQLMRKKISLEILWLSIILGLVVLSLRYYRGEVFLGYFIAFQPFIFLLSAWALDRIYRVQRVTAIVILTAIVVSNVGNGWKIWYEDLDRSYTRQLSDMVTVLHRRYSDADFTPYLLGDTPEDRGYGVLIMLVRAGYASENGMPIGICKAACPAEYPIITYTDLPDPYAIVDLRGVDISAINREYVADLPPRPPWKKFTVTTVYENIALWWRTQPLTSPFSLSRYILEKFGL